MEHEPEPLLSGEKVLVGIDDTDTVESEYGTGRISRLLGSHLDDRIAELDWLGSVRQQLLVDPRVPYTTHNSSATLICEVPSTVTRQNIVDIAAEFVEGIAADGSDPGLCVGRTRRVGTGAQEFGVDAGETLVTEQRAYDVARENGLFLDDYGGTGEGVIGALAGVGRTATGDRGRFVGYGNIRSYSGDVSVSELRSDGILVASSGGKTLESGTVDTGDWVRPLLRGGRPVLKVRQLPDGRYRALNLDN